MFYHPRKDGGRLDQSGKESSQIQDIFQRRYRQDLPGMCMDTKIELGTQPKPETTLTL